jgi:pimeloyl-ACP methyl ester carboxylesterase
MASAFDAWQVDLHGHRAIYRIAGSGPPVVLIHGMVNSSRHWEDVALRLADRYTLIAPDLIGHGDSATPRGDYSLGAHAASIRDLLSVIGVDHATVVGHSLGGGVAMQFAYQFPHLCERLVLVSSGGVGREVNPVLRLVSLPNADVALHLLRLPTARWTGHAAASLLRRTGLALGHDAPDLVRVFDALPDATSRAAVVRTLRAVVDWRGQVVTMLDRAYLARGMPTLLVWGARDPIIPVAHAHAAHAALSGSRLEVFAGAGHFPHHSDPVRFVGVLEDFLATTVPSDHDPEHWRDLLRRGRPDEYADAHAALTEETISAATRSGT